MPAAARLSSFAGLKLCLRSVILGSNKTVIDGQLQHLSICVFIVIQVFFIVPSCGACLVCDRCSSVTQLCTQEEPKMQHAACSRPAQPGRHSRRCVPAVHIMYPSQCQGTLGNM